jgi:hypothetical protein
LVQVPPLPILEVSGGLSREGGIVVVAAEAGVALATEQCAYLARLVRMIDAEGVIRLAFTDCAAPILLRDHCCMFFDADPVDPLQNAWKTVSSGIFLPLPSILGIFGVSLLVPARHGRLMVRG